MSVECPTLRSIPTAPGRDPSGQEKKLSNAFNCDHSHFSGLVPGRKNIARDNSPSRFPDQTCPDRCER